MNNLSWYEMVKPSAEEMIAFLRCYLGANWWRHPPKKWHDTYMRYRGQCGMAAYQRGFMRIPGFWSEPAAGETSPALSAITHSHTELTPTAARIHIAYDSDGRIEWDATTNPTQIVYTELATETDDTNDHTGEWWPDSPDVNEGLNWDIRFTNETIGGTGGNIQRFRDNLAANRTVDIWYLLDTVSNDHADASANGSWGLLRANGTAKNPNFGTATVTVDIEIRVKDTGSQVATHFVDLTCIGA